MKKAIWALIPLLMVAMLITSCDKDSDTDELTVEDYIDMEITDRDGGVFGAPYGMNRCFHIVFPFTLELPDGSQIQAQDREQLHLQLQEWKDNNPGNMERPKPVFPFTIQFRDRTMMQINGPEDLEAVRNTCGEMLQNHQIGPRPHRTCFTIVYPIEIDFPDGESPVEVNSVAEFRQLLRDWRDNNEGSMDRPEIVYPITVIIRRTGEEVLINGVEGLKRLHRSCR